MAQRYALTGEYGALWIVLALAGATLDRERRGRWLSVAALVPLALGPNYVLKVAVRRRRPRLEGLPPLGRVPVTQSFPSGHAATAFAAARAGGAVRPVLGPPLLVAASLMALTRPYLGLHYPSDVLAGAGLGLLLGGALGAYWERADAAAGEAP